MSAELYIYFWLVALQAISEIHSISDMFHKQYLQQKLKKCIAKDE